MSQHYITDKDVRNSNYTYEQTSKEIGTLYQPLGRKMLLRTDPAPTHTPSGTLWLPPKKQGFMQGMPHAYVGKATVLAVGKYVRRAKPGDRIIFKRAPYARLEDMKDGSTVGLLREMDIMCYLVPGEDEDAVLRAYGASATAGSEGDSKDHSEAHPESPLTPA